MKKLSDACLRIKVRIKFDIVFAGLLLLGFSLYAQQVDHSKINPGLFIKHWNAKWILPADISPYDYGVYHFRKTFTLNEQPSEFIIHVSADNRYKLFVNGIEVCFGPARGDIDHWRYESIDIAKWLKKGRNVIASTVWNFAQYKPIAQISLQTGFILQGNSIKEEIVNTNRSWKVIKDDAFAPNKVDMSKLQTYIVVGPGDAVNGNKYPWNWERTNYNDSLWKNASEYYNGVPFAVGTDLLWQLVPRSIPFMEEFSQPIQKVRRSIGIEADSLFLTGKKSLIVPAKSKVTILLDQTFLTNAYPELTVSNGKGSRIICTYAEALIDENRVKGNRNDIENKKIIGNSDIFIADGGNLRTFTTLWFRTFRYLQIEIETMEEPLIINKLTGKFTGYPFRENASFACNDSSLSQIWKVGWRTARLCAGETYYDCPYYEQLQYIGDTRIQSLISLYVSGDDRLMRNALSLFDKSRIPEGLTRSRYPSSVGQVISTFSLIWILMVHDYWMQRDDPEFVEDFLPGIKNVLKWFEDRIDKNSGMIGPLPYWSFVDWPDQWPWSNESGVGGVPPGGQTGNSSIVTLQTTYAMQAATEMLRYFGDTCTADHYKFILKGLIKSTMKLCWDDSGKYIADTPAKKDFSQHANTMAILTGAVDSDKSAELITRTLYDSTLTQCTFYFRFYLYRAMKLAGLGDLYTQMLEPWKNMLALGLTTFAERPEPTRSDCHAWSSSPNYELLATVCGIEPAEPGFKSVKIEPHLGNLQWVEGKLPHPLGNIIVKLKKTSDNILNGTVVLPENLKGTFIFGQHSINLKSGENQIELN
jgi:alpha-L-rhamnosidase